MLIESRKKDHVELVVKSSAQYSKTTGLEKVDFIHNALPEISFDSVNLSLKFLNKKLKNPLMIIGMTGGYEDAKKINKNLAKAAQKYGLAMGLGSQRAMIEKPNLTETYQVRDVAPDIPLIGNIGAFQLKKYTSRQIDSMIKAVEADALAIHLNPLQEVIQKEGDTDFSGVLKAIAETAASLEVPIIVKETGAGISGDVALKLKDAGVNWIDVSGSGGTSWSKVEYLRHDATEGFEDWGIPTLDCILSCRGILPLIASGGIRSGIDCAKTIALGADLAGAAYPFLKAAADNRLDLEIEKFLSQLRICAFLSGSKTHDDLKKAKMMFR